MPRNRTGESRKGPAGECLTCGALVAFAVPVVVWWLVGDLSRIEPGGSDQIISFRGFDQGVEMAVGVVALVVLTVASLVLWISCARRLDRGWFGLLARLVAAGALLAVLVRIATAKTSGANIGGGMILFGGIFVWLYLLARAWDQVRRLAR